LVSVLALAGCSSGSEGNSDGAGEQDLSALPVAGILSQSSWKLKAEELPAENIGSWIEKIASAISGSTEKCRWQTEKMQAGELYSCVTGKDASSRIFQFLKAGDPPTWTYLSAQPDKAFIVNRPGIAPTNVLSPAERLSWFANDSKKGLSYSWAGCFENSGQTELADIRMRLWLMLRDSQGQHSELAGKERKYTARSGIPSKLAVGEFFCTTLEVKDVPADWAARAGFEVVAVIDARWSDARGFMHIGPVQHSELDFSSLSGKDVTKTAVLIDANIYSSKPGKILRKIGSDPLLFDVDHQEGRWLRGKSADGLGGWIKADTAWAVFEDVTPSDENSKAALDILKTFLQNLASLNCSAASPYYINATALDCSSIADFEKKRQFAELLFHPVRLKFENPELLSLEAYFAVSLNGKTGRLYLENFRLARSTSLGKWVIQAEARNTALMNEFIRDCLPDES